MKRIYFICSTILMVLFVAMGVSAQILMSAGTYSQDFDSLATSGTTNTWTDNSILPGWYASKTLGGTSVTTYRADSGTSTTGAIYSYGTNDANGITERALGSVASGGSSAGNFAYGVRFTNDTDSALSNITVSYTGEQWRNGGNASQAAQTLAFSYLVSSAPILNSDASGASNWVAFTGLDFTTPTTDATAAALDGNDPANEQVFTNVVLTGVAVQPGQEIFLRWFDTNDTGNDHGVAVDNLTVSFSSSTNSTSTNVPPYITTQPQSQTTNAGNDVTFTVVASGTAPFSYQWQSNNVIVPGATNSSFTLTGVAANLTGSAYFVTVANDWGSTNSQTATLTVNAPQTNSTPVYTQTRTLRIVTYNIEADITLTNKQTTFTNVVQTPGAPLPGLIAPPTDTNNFAAGGVLEGIGEESVNGNAQPLDILALQETTSNTKTIAPIVNGLNTFYGVVGMYSNSTYQATESGNYPGSGNGPNAIIYNTHTVQLLASVPVDPPGGTSQLGSASGEYREVMRYEFAPAGVATNAANIFYIYVSHYKSGTGTTVTNSRAGEAQIIRTNTATLPAGARILAVGDFNTGVASEPMYGTLIGAGVNQFIDPINPLGSLTTNWDGTSTSILPAKTDSSTSLHYRDDYEMMTTNVYLNAANGLALVDGTYHPFGNNGTTSYKGSVNSGSNTSLNNRLVTNGPVFISAAQLYVDLTGASDHLPVVADYTIPVPTPVITGFSLAGTNLTFNVANCITGGVFTVLTSTNLSLPLTNWTTLPVTNIAGSSDIIFTATNVVNHSVSGQFYLLQEK